MVYVYCDNVHLTVSLNFVQLHSPDVDTKERYNPIFILRFSIHCLSEGYIEPVEFVGLGLLAIAFMSISSPNDRIRSLGHKTLGALRNALQVMLCFTVLLRC
jgi:nucleolar pre-ribosomal-associated protein 1